MALKDRIHDLENQPKRQNTLDAGYIRRCEDCAEDLRRESVRCVERAIKDGSYEVKGVFCKRKIVRFSASLVVYRRYGRPSPDGIPVGSFNHFEFDTSLERKEFEDRAVKKLQQEGFMCTIERISREQTYAIGGDEHKLIYKMEWE